MEKSNIANEAINHYLKVENWYFNQHPDMAVDLLKHVSTLQRFIDDNDFVFNDYTYDNGRSWINFDYNNSHTHGVLIIIDHDEITIHHSNYYGTLFIKIDNDGIRGHFGEIDNICFDFNDLEINDYTLKYNYKYQSDDEPGKMSELISYAKNYYPKAFKAKCAKQKERKIAEELNDIFSKNHK